MRELIRSIAVLLLAAWLFACPGPESVTWERRPVDEAAREAALASLKAKADELGAASKDAATQNEELAAHARTLPDVAFASTSQDGVVGIFYDGQPFIILNNLLEGRLGSSSTAPSGGRDPFVLPSGKTARLLNGFTREFPADPTPTLSSILSKKGYAPTPVEASIEGFKTVGGETVLHIRTHGGGGEVLASSGNPVVDGDGNPITLFGLWTTDPADEVHRTTYREDIYNERLVRMYEVTSPGLILDKREWHLGITREFVIHYWKSLARGAYVHVSACSTAASGKGSAGNAAFRDAILDKVSGGVYLGWSAPAKVSEMDRAAGYLIDRLTGANVLDTAKDPKEDPPQRPFDLQSIVEVMTSKKQMVQSAGATLMVIPEDVATFHSEDYLLAPSIIRLESWPREGELHLYGKFGHDQTNAKIKVGTTDCAIKSWSSSLVVCTLDQSASGEVVVTVDGRESNKVKLSSWRGKLTFAVESTTPGLSQVWTMNLHLRGDAGDYRDKPGEAPKAHRKILSMAKDSEVTVVAGGNATASDCNATWTAKTFKVELWGKADVMSGGYWLSFAGIVDDGDPMNLWFELIGLADPCYDRNLTAPKGGCSAVDSTGRCLLPASPEITTTKAADPFHVGLIGRLKKAAIIDLNGSIKAGQVDPATSLCCGGELNIPWDYTQRLSWPDMTPEAGTGPNRATDER